MDNELKLSDFDLLGMLELDDVYGIESLVTPVGNGKFISRSDFFWQSLTCREASEIREQLKSVLPFVSGKKAFVILDYMTNLSGKVFYEQVRKSLNKPKIAQVELARDCLISDISHVIELFESEGKKKITLTPYEKMCLLLPHSDDMIPERNIECNNLALIYLFTKSFTPPKGYQILNTGLGGIFIGPFFYCMHKVNWANTLKSKYALDSNPSKPVSEHTPIIGELSSDKLLILDDNCGTGDTLKELKLELIKKGFQVKVGAIQYNWINYYRVGIGEKEINRFDPTAIDYVTPFNYPGHKLLYHAISILCGQQDLNGPVSEEERQNLEPFGKTYEEYKKIKHYSNQYPDIVALMEKGKRYAEKAGFMIFDHKGNPSAKFTQDSQNLIKNLMQESVPLFPESESNPMSF